MRVDQLASSRSDQPDPASPPSRAGRPPSGRADATTRADVALLRWPAQAERREQLAVAGRPRLLLIAHSCFPPECVDALEDWMREPLDPAELEARVDRLARRARPRATRPAIDSSGLVRVGERAIDLPPIQLAVARLLVARAGRVVRADEILAACRDAGGSGHPKAVKAVIGRLRSSLADLGLRVTNVRGRGYVLEPDEPAPVDRVP